MIADRGSAAPEEWTGLHAVLITPFSDSGQVDSLPFERWSTSQRRGDRRDGAASGGVGRARSSRERAPEPPARDATLRDHFGRLADLSRLPIVMVDCPPLTAVVAAEIIAELCDRLPSLAAIKQAQQR